MALSNWYVIAGTRLLNTCPPEYSCGTAAPYWSDDVPPTEVGVPATITAYLSNIPFPSCRTLPALFNRKLQVIRCSLNTPHDLIYKYTPSGIGDFDFYIDNSTCRFAFCGMK